MLQRAFSSALHTKQPSLELQNRTISDAENDTSYIALSSSCKENSLDSYCYESYDPKAPPFEAQQFSAKFRVSLLLSVFLSNSAMILLKMETHKLFNVSLSIIRL